MVLRPSDIAESGRLVAFSDAVVAIAITLLALELPVPEGRTPGQLWEGFRHDARYFLAFFISFGVIAAMWHAHHQVFRYVARSDGRLLLLSLGWLLAIVLIPFAAKLLTVEPEGQTHTARGLLFGIYAAVQMAASGTYLLMVHRVARAGLWASDAPPDLRRRVDRRVIGLLIAFAASIPGCLRHAVRVDHVDRWPTADRALARIW